MEIKFNHVTTEYTTYRIVLTDDHLKLIEKNGFDINNKDHENDIIELIRDYDYSWDEIENNIVDGFFQDEELIK